jgi:hypothetical protein
LVEDNPTDIKRFLYQLISKRGEFVLNSPSRERVGAYPILGIRQWLGSSV